MRKGIYLLCILRLRYKKKTGIYLLMKCIRILSRWPIEGGDHK